MIKAKIFKPKQSIITKDAKNMLRKELEELLENRKSAVSELTWARDLGDRSENAAYKSARSKLSKVDSRIRFLKKTLDNAKIVESKNLGFVEIGSFVSIKSRERVSRYQIVGDHETDPQKGKISYRSPLGSRLIGRRQGEVFDLHSPNGVNTYEILKIELTALI